MASTQTLSEDDRRLLARWALACAERALPLFEADPEPLEAIRDAVARTRRYAAGEGSTTHEIRQRMVAVKAAGAASTPAGAAAGRAVAQAAAVAHMGAHALGAAAYATKAVWLAGPGDQDAVNDEIAWQLAQLDEREWAALRLLPPVGSETSGPLGKGLLSSGILGDTIREIQARLVG